MVIQILDAIFCIVVVLAYPFVCWLLIKQHDKEREKWYTERSKLLDRIQSSGLAEFKAQERADTPIKRIIKDPLIAKLESEPWL